MERTTLSLSYNLNNLIFSRSRICIVFIHKNSYSEHFLKHRTAKMMFSNNFSSFLENFTFIIRKQIKTKMFHYLSSFSKRTQFKNTITKQNLTLGMSGFNWWSMETFALLKLFENNFSIDLNTMVTSLKYNGKFLNCIKLILIN